MARLFVPTLGPTDWRRLLADPDSQWRPERSALEFAVCWESARESTRGIPREVCDAIDSTVELRGAELVVGFPEHKVSFQGGGHPSQNDLWALLSVGPELVSLAVEAKAGEKLDGLVRDWLPKDGERSQKPERLAELQRLLALSDANVSAVRYQLLHRTASALKEAERFHARWAAVMIHSFNRSADEDSWQDFRYFGNLLGAQVEEGRFVQSQTATRVPLFLGWVSSEPAGKGRLSSAV